MTIPTKRARPPCSCRVAWRALTIVVLLLITSSSFFVDAKGGDDDYYRILGVKKTANDKAIKKAYRKVSRYCVMEHEMDQ